MTDDLPEGIALYEYNRAMLQEAQDRVVAEAEQEVAQAWAMDLLRMRQHAQEELFAAQVACRKAWAQVCAVRGLGESRRAAAAQLCLELAQDDLRRAVSAARMVVGTVAEQLELITAATEERSSLARLNRIRVWSAWCEAVEAGWSVGSEPEYEFGVEGVADGGGGGGEGAGALE